MAVEDQVALIYSGVRGYLDKIDPSQITRFEIAFLAHMRNSHQDILDDIKAKTSITDETDAKLKQIVISFVKGFIESWVGNLVCRLERFIVFS